MQVYAEDQLDDDGEMSADVDAFDSAVLSVAPKQTQRVLDRVALVRQRDDADRGYWRDYPDVRAIDVSAPSIIPASSRDIDSWWCQLARQSTMVRISLDQSRKDTIEALERMAALAVNWIEAIEQREEKRVKMMRGPRRWLYNFRLWLSKSVAP